MNKPLIIKPQLFKQLLSLPRDLRACCWESISQLPESFGHPHAHLGLGIRKLPPIFSNAGRGWDCDCCSGIATRVWNFFVGNRDQVQAFLRSGKYG